MRPHPTRCAEKGLGRQATRVAPIDQRGKLYTKKALPVIKTIGFGNIVNTTLGLPIIRTSVDHGVALDIAGSGKASFSSLQNALDTAKSMI